jgi:hypothetical protein
MGKFLNYVHILFVYFFPFLLIIEKPTIDGPSVGGKRAQAVKGFGAAATTAIATKPAAAAETEASGTEIKKTQAGRKRKNVQFVEESQAEPDSDE